MPLFLLHGWMDVSASFQFIVDHLSGDWNVIALDWPGFGLSDWLNRTYYFADYLAVLDAVLDRYSPSRGGRLVGHSMGGNIACLYAGIRPHRVEAIMSLEGFGIAPTSPAMAGERFVKWLDQLKDVRHPKRYPNRQGVVTRLLGRDPYLTKDKAEFLATHLTCGADGDWAWAADPFHRVANPVLYRLDESLAIWRSITCPVIWVVGRESAIHEEFAARPGDWDMRKSCFSTFKEIWVDDATHMLHHDRPDVIARLIDHELNAASPP
ncbi:MAG: alpha/beta hydrolase [Proteobacteria bacterium]|nr:alpha/beta hydrolase [Pseudomonadota bacterium]